MPTEYEWEIAAGSLNKMVFPWGNNYQPGRGNSREEGIETTTPVGSFPVTESPFGLIDTFGNVSEYVNGFDISTTYFSVIGTVGYFLLGLILLMISITSVQDLTNNSATFFDVFIWVVTFLWIFVGSIVPIFTIILIIQLFKNAILLNSYPGFFRIIYLSKGGSWRNDYLQSTTYFRQISSQSQRRAKGLGFRVVREKD